MEERNETTAQRFARRSESQFASPAGELTLGDVVGMGLGLGVPSFDACSENEMGEAPCLLLDCHCRACCCRYQSPATDNCATAAGADASRINCLTARGFGKGNMFAQG